MRGINLKMMIGILLGSQLAFGAIQHGNQTIKGALNVTGLTTLGTASSTQFNADNLRLDGNTLSTTNTNGDLTIDLNGTGSTIFADLTATTVPYLDASKKLTSSAATPTQLGYLANASANLCGISQSCTLTNHTLTGNTAANLISGSGTFVLNTTGTMTVPDGTDTLGALGIAQTFTNKTLTAPAINAANLNFGTASNTNRLLLPKDTTTNLDALTDTQSAIAFDTTTGKPVYNNGAGWIEVGSGSGAYGGSGINMLAGFNNNAELATTANWSQSGGGSLSVTSTSADVANGTYSFSWDASANNDYLITDARSIPSGLFGANCLAEFYYKGFDSNITAQVYDGTNVIAAQALVASGSYTKTQINFICPQSGTLALKFLASANAAIGYVDEAHLGSATNVSSQSIVTPWVQYTPVFAGLGTVTGIDMWSRRVGDSLQIQGKWVNGTVTASTASMQMGYNGVSGNVFMDTTKVANTKIVGVGSRSPVNVAAVTVLATSGQGSLLNFSLDTQATQSPNVASLGNAAFGTGEGVYINATIPIQGWSAMADAVLNNSQNWRVDANISGANPSLGGSNVATYTGIENASLTLANASGSGVLTSQIPCSSTNSPSGTTCAAGNESVGVSFTIPSASDALACVSFGHNLFNGAGGSAAVTFQIVETPSNAQTISQEGKSRISSQHQVANSSAVFPYRLCGTFSFASAGQKTLRLMYEQSTGGTITTNALLADADTGNGQRDIHWEVYPISQVAGQTMMRPPSYYRYIGSYDQSTSHYWSSTAASYGDFTTTGTISNIGINQLHNSGFGTVSRETSNLPGASFVAPKTGTVRVTFVVSVLPGQTAAANTWAIQLFESTGSVILANASGTVTSQNTINSRWPVTLIGYLPVTQGSTYNLKLRAATTAGSTMYVGASTVGTALTVNLEYVD